MNAYSQDHRGGTRHATHAQDFLHIWQDMCAIREFETILNEIKTKGAYKNLTYNHAGPAHLSIGQEAAAVGMAFCARRRRTTSSARTAATARFWPRASPPSASSATTSCSRSCGRIATARCCGRSRRATAATCRDSRVRFFVYGAYSEIFARETGFNRGLGGSMHAFFAPFGIYPNNAIVGGSGSIAPGRGAVQARQSQAGHRGGEHRRRLVRLRPGVGRHHAFRRWTSTARCGTNRWAAACRSFSTA